MQIGLWAAENKWDEEVSAGFLEANGQNKEGTSTPEELEVNFRGKVKLESFESIWETQPSCSLRPKIKFSVDTL